MKKFVIVMIFAFVAAFSVSICSAYDYDSDSNYKFVTTQNGMWYLYLPSVDVQEYNPPHYQIAGNFVGTDGYDRKRESIEIVRFNWYTKETFHKNKYGNWEKEEVSDDYHKRYPKLRANALFRAAYGMNFYN